MHQLIQNSGLRWCVFTYSIHTSQWSIGVAVSVFESHWQYNIDEYWQKSHLQTEWRRTNIDSEIALAIELTTPNSLHVKPFAIHFPMCDMCVYIDFNSLSLSLSFSLSLSRSVVVCVNHRSDELTKQNNTNQRHSYLNFSFANFFVSLAPKEIYSQFLMISFTSKHFSIMSNILGGFCRFNRLSHLILFDFHILFFIVCIDCFLGIC